MKIAKDWQEKKSKIKELKKTPDWCPIKLKVYDQIAQARDQEECYETESKASDILPR